MFDIIKKSVLEKTMKKYKSFFSFFFGSIIHHLRINPKGTFFQGEKSLFPYMSMQLLRASENFSIGEMDN